jgi:hypothetical protein
MIRVSQPDVQWIGASPEMFLRESRTFCRWGPYIHVLAANKV